MIIGNITLNLFYATLLIYKFTFISNKIVRVFPKKHDSWK